MKIYFFIKIKVLLLHHNFLEVNYLKNYSIPFKNLKEGIHSYDFIVDNKFFELFEKTEVTQGNLNAFIRLEKRTTFMVLELKVIGIINITCDRCLEPFDMQFENRDKIIFKYGEEISDSRYVGEDVQVFSYDEAIINVAQFIYEIIHIGLPLKKVHKDDEEGNPGCNKELLNELEKYIVKKEKKEESDPRWDKLKKIINKN